MGNRVLGKIATVLSVNAKPLQTGLNLAKGELTSFASTVQSRLTSAGSSAERALKGMYTDFQKLERAVKAANSQRLNLKVENAKAILDVAKATERIAKPAVEAQKQFSNLSQTVQAELLPVLKSAQKQTETFFDRLSTGAKASDRDLANTAARVDRVLQSLKRASEASQAVRGLASGQELRFQNPEFLRSTARAAQLQQQAAALPPEAIASRGIATLVGEQNAAAAATERLRAALERTIQTRTGDQEAARRAYTEQRALLDQVNDRLERQIQLERQSQDVNANVGASTQLRSTADPTGRSIQQRVQDIFAMRVASEEAAAYRERAADAAEREAQATAQTARQLSAFDTTELDRRSGALSRARANAFEDATSGLRGPPQPPPGLFTRESDAEAMARELQRTQQLQQQFRALPPATQQSLEAERAALNGIAQAATAGAAGVGVLADANDRWEGSVTRVTAALAEQARQRQALANTMLPILNEESDQIEGRATPLAGRRNPRNQVRSELTGNLAALDTQVRDLPETLRGEVGPAVDNLTTRVQNLGRAGFGFTVDQARQLSREVNNIRNALNARTNVAERFRDRFGGGAASLNVGVDERALNAVGAQIEFVQGRLSALAREARGPVLQALAALSARAEALFSSGAFNTDEAQAELQQLRTELARALATAGGGSERQVAQQLQRVGDVARGSFGNAGLAVQQAAFALDDFFSVTGGLDQRVRAAGNNISQLGFILGGTEGLILGIAASIGSQLVVALVNWYNAGRTTEDQLKALNDTLSKQKSLVEDLAKAFESLGESIAEGAFSGPAREARKFEQELDRLQKKQREAREERVAGTDVGVQFERGRQNSLRRSLQSETDGGRRVVLQADLDASIARERELSRASARREVTGAGVASALERGIVRVGEAVFGQGGSENDPSGANAATIRGRAAAAAAAVPLGTTLDDVLAQRAAAQRFIDENSGLARRANQNFFIRPSGATEASEEVARFQNIIRTLERPLQQAGDDLAIQLFRAGETAATVIADSQQQVADAIAAGVPGALALRGTLDILASELDSAFKAIAQAEEDFANDRISVEERSRILVEQRARIERSRGRRDRALDAAGEINRERVVDPARLFDARRARAEANLQEAGLGDSATARRIRELEARRDEIQRQLQREGGSDNPFAVRRAARATEAVDREIAAIEATTIALRSFAAALNRAEQEAKANLDSAQQRADEVRRSRLAPGVGDARPEFKEAERAKRDLARQKELNAKVEDETAKARLRLEEKAKDPNDPLAATFARLREIEELAKRGLLTPELVDERRRLQSRVDAAAKDDPSVAAARDESTREAERQAAVARGNDIARTDRERVRRDTARQAADVKASFDDPLGGVRELGESMNLLAQRQMEQVAPTIAGFREERMNALLQGPSRAALNAADTNTMEGQKELNRLLRGDDPAKDVNLIELKKQSELLQEVVDAINEQAEGTVVEIRG